MLWRQHHESQVIYAARKNWGACREYYSAAEVRFSLVLFPNAKPNHRFSSAIWSNPGPNITECVREVRFAFEPGLTKLADDRPPVLS